MFAVTNHNHLLFVYGTLRRGSRAAPAALLRAEARWLGVAEAGGRLYDIGGYPGLVAAEDARVEGDLFAMTQPAALLPMLDAYEECSAAFAEPHEYRRERIAVHFEGRDVMAWTYVYARAAERLVAITSWDAANGRGVR